MKPAQMTRLNLADKILVFDLADEAGLIDHKA